MSEFHAGQYVVIDNVHWPDFYLGEPDEDPAFETPHRARILDVEWGEELPFQVELVDHRLNDLGWRWAVKAEWLRPLNDVQKILDALKVLRRATPIEIAYAVQQWSDDGR